MNEKVIERLIEDYELLRVKSQKYLALYPKLVRAGFILIFTVPILFMILMFTVEQKLIFLVLWIVSILVIAGYLITIEYIYFYYMKLHEEFEALRNAENTDKVAKKTKTKRKAKRNVIASAEKKVRGATDEKNNPNI